MAFLFLRKRVTAKFKLIWHFPVVLYFCICPHAEQYLDRRSKSGNSGARYRVQMFHITSNGGKVNPDKLPWQNASERVNSRELLSINLTRTMTLPHVCEQKRVLKKRRLVLPLFIPIHELISADSAKASLGIHLIRACFVFTCIGLPITKTG